MSPIQESLQSRHHMSRSPSPLTPDLHTGAHWLDAGLPPPPVSWEPPLGRGTLVFFLLEFERGPQRPPSPPPFVPSNPAPLSGAQKLLVCWEPGNLLFACPGIPIDFQRAGCQPPPQYVRLRVITIEQKSNTDDLKQHHETSSHQDGASDVRCPMSVVF